MHEFTNSIHVVRDSGNRRFDIYGEYLAQATFRYIKATDKPAEYRDETCAVTLCFVRGTGKIAINGNRVEYSRRWFEIPRRMDYQVFPETDTVMLTLEKPTSSVVDTKADPVRRNQP